ncbi:MAG: FAD-dependent monooxygenase [Gemmatimonadetes bacterium]|nr:FAD-dependent monooxygenase [Gemmatimonadota bacterium]
MTARDVLVVGGGPAGAATAAFAARSGLSVLLVDRAVFPRHKACAEYLSPEAARDLEALGVLEEVEAAGAAKLTGFRLVSDDGAAVIGRFAGSSGFTPFRPYGLALSRARLDSIVLQAAARAGAEVRQGVALERLLVEDGVVRGGLLRDAGRRWKETARAVVGADGLNSLVARTLGLARRSSPRRLALVAHLMGVAGMEDYGEMFAGRGRYVGIAPIEDGLVNAAAVVPVADARAVASDAARFFFKQLGRAPELRRRMAGARLARKVMIAGPFARTTRRAVADGALLVGDAADFFDPFTGEGIFAALRGGRLAAETLAAALARGEATREALRPYAFARRRAFLGKWVLERIVGLGATLPLVMRGFTRRLARRAHVVDLWVGAAGDSVPVRTLFAPRHLAAFVV